MKAGVLEAKGSMIYQEVAKPTPGPKEVLVKVRSVSVCGSDIKRYISGHRMYPIILGHECGGVIESVGDSDDQDLIGKKVSIIPLVPCFNCESCNNGLYSACKNYSFIGSREAGCYADYAAVPKTNILIVPDQLSYDHIALIEPSSVARHMLAMGDFKEGQTAVVFGAGSIGLLVVQWLRIKKAKQIICVDISDTNLEAAAQLGATLTLNPLKNNIPDEVYKVTGNGVDISFEAAGVPQTLELTIPVTRPRGKVVCAGNQPTDRSISLEFIENLMRRELSIIGNHMSYSKPFPGIEWTETITHLLDQQLNMELMISHKEPLSEISNIFKQIATGKFSYRKIMLSPED